MFTHSHTVMTSNTMLSITLYSEENDATSGVRVVSEASDATCTCMYFCLYIDMYFII